MKSTANAVGVSILGKEFQVSCPENARDSLFAAARYLDAKMREIQESGRVIGMDRCAVLAALNITNELLELRKGQSSTGAVDTRLQFLHDRIEAFLQQEASAEAQSML